MHKVNFIILVFFFITLNIVSGFAFVGFNKFIKMSDDGSTAVEKKGRGRPKANGTQSVKIVF